MERAKHATVMVLTAASKSAEGDTPVGSGTGFFVNSTGLLLTNNHVVDPGHGKSEQEKFDVMYKGGRLVWTVVTDSGTDDEHEWRGEVLYQNEQADMAVLQVRNDEGDFLETPNYLRFLASSDVSLKLKAWCLGFPGGDSRKRDAEKHAQLAITSGNVVELPKSSSGRLLMIVTDVLANPGNSGGPFIDMKGRVIGIATLAGTTEARAATTMLVPADLTMEMIQMAFRREKIPAGVDIRPFYDLFVTEARVWNIPMRPRLQDVDCVTMEDGSRLCGSAVDESLNWPAGIGDIKVPRRAMAYVLTEGAEAIVFLDGGDRFVINRDEARLQFALSGGQPFPLNLDDVAFIAFRAPEEPPPVPTEAAYVIAGSNIHLSLLNVSGDVRFDAKPGGPITVSAAMVSRIETGDTDRILHTGRGSRLMGRFLPHKLKGRLAWSGTEVEFSFEGVGDAGISMVDYTELQRTREIDLAESLKTTDQRLIKIARLLDGDQISAAKPLLDVLLEPDDFRGLSPGQKEQVKFLEGEFLLRSGHYPQAEDVFKGLKRATVPDVLWHARSRLAMLERFNDGQFNGESISDADVFERAGRALATEFIQDARRGIDGTENARPEKRTDYLKLMKRGSEVEEKLLIANRLTGGKSEEYLVLLWRMMARLQVGEVERLQKERQEMQGLLQEGGRGTAQRLSDFQRRQIDQKIERIGRDIEDAQATYVTFREKIVEAGFIIDDPDALMPDDDD